MAIPGGMEMVVILAVSLLLILALPAGFVIKWMREGYNQGKDEEANQPEPPS